MRSRRKEEEQEEEEGMSPVGGLGGKLICGVWLWGLCWSRHCGWWGGVVGVGWGWLWGGATAATAATAAFVL
jgi:hypothetical protein